MKKDKALQVCSYYMGTRLYQNLFDEFEKEGIEHDILYFASNTTRIDNPPDNFIFSKAYNPIDRFIFSVKHRKVYNDIIKKINPNDYYLTHAHSLVSNGYISNRLKQDYGIPYIVAVRNTDLFTFFKVLPHSILLGRKIMNEAERVVFLSKAYRDLTINKYVAEKDKENIMKKSLIIPNGVDDYYLENKRTEIKDISKPIKLIYVGRVDDLNKNVLTTIKACDLLIKKGNEIELTLVGRFESKIFKKIIPKRDYIKYIGKTDKVGVREQLLKNNIFVMPSKRETFGLVYVEAMSQGLPVIYTKGQGFDTQFKEGEVGYHVQYNDAEEIAETILKIAKNYKKMSENAIKKSEEFNWEDISKIYIENYNQIRKEEEIR